MASRSRMVGRRVLMLSLLASAMGATGMAHAGTSPTGGQVVSGNGQIQQSGNTTTINQSSKHLSVNWQAFDIGAGQTVNFVQPGRSAIAVNRVLGNDASQIFGHLNANGQVWLINPNGVLFGRGAQVAVGGIVASTLGVDDASVGSSTVHFSGNGKGRITNQGTITAANGGYVALVGNQVSNQGVIRAQLGTVALGGGSAVTLTFNDSHLLNLQVDKSTLDNLAENRQLIVADGGQVVMTAGARDSLLASVVNNTGTVQAQSVQEHDGVITLLGGMDAGTVNVGGTLDASAPHGGNGGQIETSAAQFQLASDAKITAAAPKGNAGTWLVDPTNLTIDAAAASTISGTLGGGTNVTEQTNADGTTSGSGTTSAGAGDINVAAPITWNNAAATLTLTAFAGINVNAQVSGTGGIVMNAPNGTLTIGNAGGLSAGTGATLAAKAFVNQAGAGALGSKWLLYSVNPTSNTLGGLAPNFIQYNATKATALAAAGNGLIYSVAPTLRVTGLTGTVTKVYDNTNAATFTGSNLTTTGLTGGDTITSATGGTYGSVNVGNNLTVTSPNAIGNFVIANGAIPVFGYTLGGSPVTANVGRITGAPLTAQVIGNPTKVYDGTTTATLGSANYQLTGFVAGQGATVKQPSSVGYVGADAGSQLITATFSSTNFAANSGTVLSNYILPTTGSGMGFITQAPLLIKGLLGTNKIYDGTTGDALDTANSSLFGVIAPDAGNVTLDSSAAVGTFSQANVGSGIGITATGFILGGSKAHNYTLVSPTGLSANITPKALTVAQVTANNKIYDNSTSATLNTTNATLSGLVGSDNVTLSTLNAAAAFGQTDVGNNLAVTTSGFSLGGTAAGNYTLSQPSLLAAITPALLNVTMQGNPTKTYDGTNAVNLGSANFNITGFIPGQGATVSQSSATYATANAGTGINVTAALQPSDFTPDSGTSLSNYMFAPTVTGTGLGTINPLQLTGQIVGNPTKVFDNTTSAALAASNFNLVGLLPGQAIAVAFGGTAPGTYDDASAGAHGVSANALPAGDYVAGNGTLLSNYVLPALFLGSGTITPAPLSGQVINAGIVNASKVYDGLLTITLGASNFALSGFVGSDSATVNASTSVTGTFGQKDVGTNIPLSANLLISDLVAGSGTNLNNYTLSAPSFGVGNITPAPLVVNIIGNPTKVYNGSTDVALTSGNFLVTGWVPGESGSIDPSATSFYDSANAGARVVTAMLTPGNYIAGNNTKLTNYTLVDSATGPGTINRAPLFITGVFATNRTYNATNVDALNTAAAGLAGLVDGDSPNVALDLTGATAAFGQANVGNHLAVAATGFQITGSQSANYVLQPLTGLFASISKATLTLSGITANNKTYDGTTAATLGGVGSATLGGIFGGDNVGFDGSSAVGTFNTANAGTNLKVQSSGFLLTGGAAGNYQLTQPGNLSANINPKQLTAVITGSPTKVYDGSNSATLTADDYDLQGFVGTQHATIPQSATANYVTKNAGTGLGVESTLVTSDFLADAGTNLANYILPTTGAGNNGVIEQKVLDLTGTRVYDATTGANASLFGPLDGVNGETLGVTGAGALVSKNVGNEVAFANLGSLVLANGGNGGLASNYTLIGGTDWVTITPAMLSASFTAQDKTYDANTTATLNAPATLTGLLGSDSVTLNNASSATFSDKNAGVAKKVTGAMSISGTDAANYIFTQGTTTATINKLVITPGLTAVSKPYDGTTSDPGASVNSPGVLAGDTVTFGNPTINFADKNVANNITVTATGITTGGKDGANYALSTTSATALANITPRVINLSGTEIYNGSPIVNANTFGNGVVAGQAGETLTLVGSYTLPSKNVGNYAWANGGTGLSLADGTGLSSNYTLLGGIDSYIVTPRPLTATFTADSKEYDGNTAAVLENAALVAAGGSTTSGLVTGDAVSLTNPAAGTFDNKNVGTNKLVTGAMGITGGDAGNYVFTNGTSQANITAKTITVSAAGHDKTYDGTTADPLLVLSGAGVVAGDTVTFSDTSQAFVSKDVGQNILINVGGIALGGSGASNYVLANTTTTTTANIIPAIINLTGTRVYDGTALGAASLFTDANGHVAGVNGELLGLTGSAANLLSKNVAVQGGFANFGDLALGNGTNGGLASNYTLVGGTDWVTITPKALTATTTPVSRDYDGTTIIALDGSALSGLVAGDDITLGNASQGTVASKNVGNGLAVTTAMTISGTDLGNYTFSQPMGLVADITPLAITVSATAANKAYDTTTTATLTSLLGNGVLAGDSVSFTAGSANFSDANAANGKRVDVLGITSAGTDAGNYTFNTTTSTSADITPIVLDLTGTRVYDGTTGAAANLFGANGVLTGIAGQTVNLGGSGIAASKNVASNATMAGLGSLVLADGGNGGLAQNYTLVGGTDIFTITPKAINVAATGIDKTYDTTTTAGVTLAGQGVVAGDDIGFTPGSANFASPNAGNGIGITVAGITASGADAGNYTYINTATTSANIIPVVLNISGSRVYDGSTSADASLFGANGVLTGIAGQTINLGGSGVAASKNVATNAALGGLGTLALADGGNGGLAQNYTLVGGMDTLSITPKAITVDATGSNKTYDGTTAASVGLAGNGLVAGDQVSFAPGAANYATPNVGNGIAIDVTGITSSGADASNYSFVNTATTSGNIIPAILNLTGTRTYDGTTSAAATLFGNQGVLTGVNGETLTLTGSGTIGNKNVGNQKPFAAGGLAGFGLDGNGGALASNYTLAGGTDWLTITPATLTVVGTTTSNRVYDGTLIDQLTGATLSGLFGNDNVQLGNASTGIFDTRHVGNGKAVTTAMTVSGGDAANYILVQPTGLTANVTPLPIVVNAKGTNKMFDGSVLDKVTLTSNGILAGDQVTFTSDGAVFGSSGPGTGKTVTVSGIEGEGADAGDYLVTNPVATTTADITGGQSYQFGVDNGSLAQLQGVVGPSLIPTPYGVAEQDSVGEFTGNQKKQHRPVERNRARADFASGLALKVQDGGVRLPPNALP